MSEKKVLYSENVTLTMLILCPTFKVFMCNLTGPFMDVYKL